MTLPSGVGCEMQVTVTSRFQAVNRRVNFFPQDQTLGVSPGARERGVQARGLAPSQLRHLLAEPSVHIGIFHPYVVSHFNLHLLVLCRHQGSLVTDRRREE